MRSDTNPLSQRHAQSNNNPAMAQNDLAPYLMGRTPSGSEGVTNVRERWIDDERSPSWQAYREVIRKRLGIIVTFVLSVVLTVGYLTLRKMPIYATTATLLIERKAPQLADIQPMLSEPFDTEQHDYYKTQYEILKSKSLAAQVIQEHHLESIFPAIEPKPKSRIKQWLNAMVPWTQTKPSESEAPPTPAKHDRDYAHGVPVAWIDAYHSMMTIKPVEHTQLVRIIFRAANPDLAARLANAHAETYIRLGLRLRTETKQEAQDFLAEKLGELKERVQTSEAALNDYRRSQDIISPVAKDNLVIARLEDLNQRLTDAEADRIGLEAQMRLIRGYDYNAVPAVINSSLIHGYKQQLLSLEGEYADLLTKYKSEHPKLAPYKAQLTYLQQHLDREIQQIVSGIDSAYRTAQVKEQELRDLVEQQKAKTLAFKDASVGYAILEREVDTNRQLYDSVLQRMKEIKIVGALHAPNATVLDRADVPSQPSGSQTVITLTLSVIVGLLGGVGFALLIEQLDNTFTTLEEVKRDLRLPVLGTIPNFRSLPPYTCEQQAQRPWVDNLGNMMLVISHPYRSAVAEIYAKLCTAIMLSQPEAAPKRILFTSAVSGEGKTTNAVNIAMMFALSGARVLLIDADARNPSCHKVMGMGNHFGLTELLTGQLGMNEVIQPTTVQNLSLITAGSSPPNPTVLVGSRKIYATLMALEQDYDCICIDSPPVMPVSDAELLSTMVHGVVLVVDAQTTPKQTVKEARARLTYARANLLGVVLNRMTDKRTDYGYYANVYPTQTKRRRSL